MNILKFLSNFFSSKENRIDNLEAQNIMISENYFNKDSLTLGSIFKVNQNIKLKNFKNKILSENLTIVVTDNKGKTIGYISKKEIDNI
ncbi:hypothetical protein OA415_01405 [Pelagibacteraceae bacterium]|nr:hypothetical protein [Pelagibacteraceae bacterium]